MKRLLLNISDLSSDESRKVIEDELFSLPGVTIAQFVSENQLLIEAENNDRLPSVLQVRNVVNTIDSAAEVTKERSTISSLSKSNLAFTGGISLLCFVLSLVLPIPAVFKLILQIISAASAGYDTLIFAVKSVRNRKADDNIIVLISVIAAFIIGRGADAAAVMLIFRIGKFAENALSLRLERKARILSLKLPTAVDCVNSDGEIIETPVKKLPVGSFIRPKAGTRLPFDCRIIKDELTVDCSVITGDSVSITLSEGEFIPGGSLITDGDALLKTVSTDEDSANTKIMQLLSRDSHSKTVKERFASKLYAVYLAVILITAAAAIILPCTVFDFSLKAAIYNATVIFIAATPAVMLAIAPLGFDGIFTAAANQGVFARDTSSLEKLAQLDTISIDRSLISGKSELTVSKVIATDKLKESDILGIIASIAKDSDDETFKTIVKAAGKGEYLQFDALDYKEGYGYVAFYHKKPFICGNAALINEVGISTDGCEEGNVFLCYGKKLVGAVCISKTFKSKNKKLIESLRISGFKKVYLLDESQNNDSELLSENLGTDGVIHSAANTVYLGDSPESTKASLLSASTANRDADIMICSRKLSALAKVKASAVRGTSVIGLNLWLTSNLKAVIVILAFFGYMPLTVAAILEILSSLAIIFNNSRIQKFK